MALTKKCGPHCGIKDGYEGHCGCTICHGTKPKLRKRKLAKMRNSSSYGKNSNGN